MNQEQKPFEGSEEIEPGRIAGVDTTAGASDGSDELVKREMSRRSRRSFLVAGGAALFGFAGYKYLRTRDEIGGVPWPLRSTLQFNESIARSYFSPNHLAPTFSRALARLPRVNGGEGMSDDFDAASWTLQVQGLDESATRQFSLDEIKRLPRFEMITELKCIEGWSQVVSWAGARLGDFTSEYFSQPVPSFSYVSLETPDGGYYVGLDRDSALHPQTLLCYEMDGRPLAPEHGAPLRLAIPVKYGIKNIKRIGRISYTNERPADFWADRGYDWYAGL